MKIVAFLQNQWFRDPDAARRMYERSSHPRHRLNARCLFAGCKTGRVLRKVFGDLCDDIIWENASAEIGGCSSSAFDPDLSHMADVICEHRPDVVLVFGTYAQAGLAKAEILMGDAMPDRVFRLPHPISRIRGGLQRLRDAATTLQTIQQEQSA